ncbi:hypothetical protein GCK72_019357 [Caenorhabditis remanei]|uniref:Uncharacterized protein n=3 Tax=Caenorhabditis TaxID=6237 RepID=A0A6A5GE96_CAERE|nr:hypothetical protein GCK72_019357 [Caenorhabditis remanei]KAF1752802.1 hypothetical protein GCK72_019357 [Caenorhabditis remanei]
MSEYLGWRNRKPGPGRDRSSDFDRDVIPGGAHTKSYESYVRNIFHPTNRLKPRDKEQLVRDHGLSATSILRAEREFGKHALDEKYDREHFFEKMPLENLYQELGIKNPASTNYRSFQVYEPKSSSEYFAATYEAERERRKKDLDRELASYDKEEYEEYTGEPKKNLYSSLSSYRAPLSSYKTRADEEYEKNNTTTLIDYKDFASSPLSPYLYQSHPYVRSQDSRIIGSNFVQLTSRPKDKFLSKIDETLAMVRDMPRY